jgi:hypothetical protein
VVYVEITFDIVIDAAGTGTGTDSGSGSGVGAGAPGTPDEGRDMHGLAASAAVVTAAAAAGADDGGADDAAEYSAAAFEAAASARLQSPPVHQPLRLTLETAPIALLPYSVHSFLQLVDSFEGGSVYANAPHVLQVCLQ